MLEVTPLPAQRGNPVGNVRKLNCFVVTFLAVAEGL
ncbi:MAG: hypothetical protein RIS52_475 [Pseudomonadota bacterium]|jgi:hypothetical protein